MVSVAALIVVSMGGCGVSLEERPTITAVLKERGVDPGNPDEVQSFENELLSGVRVKYDLSVEKVAPATLENRSFFDGVTGVRREVEVVRFAGYGTRDGTPSAYAADLYIFDHTGDVWTTLVWTDIELSIAGEVISEEGYRVSMRDKGSVSSLISQGGYGGPESYIACRCDLAGGTVSGAVCTEQDCEDLETCSKKVSNGTLNGSCALIGMLKD